MPIHPPRRALLLALLVALSLLPACREEGKQRPSPDQRPPPPRVVFGGQRPARLQLPAPYDRSRRRPLVIVLHGYGGVGQVTAANLGYLDLVDKAGFLLLVPEGVENRVGRRFWNAGQCCDYFDRGVDDVAYLSGLIDEVRAAHPVDPRRVFVVGHSNGAHMAHRLACARSERIAAVVALAGALFPKPPCTPRSPVSVLHIHGDRDPVVPYGGGRRERPTRFITYPSARQTVEAWARLNRCGDLAVAGRRGGVTRRAARGCPPGVDVALWTVSRGGHEADVLPHFARRTWAWLARHPKREAFGDTDPSP